jgi:hypothetical protein
MMLVRSGKRKEREASCVIDNTPGKCNPSCQWQDKESDLRGRHESDHTMVSLDLNRCGFSGK